MSSRCPELAKEKTCAKCGKTFSVKTPMSLYAWKKGSKAYCGEHCYNHRNEGDIDVLAKARLTYGNQAQLSVAMEELAELIQVVARYPRYNTHAKAVDELKLKALDEVADVYIVLEHIKAIFELNEEDVINRMESKLNRVKRWLNTNNELEQTTKDRTV